MISKIYLPHLLVTSFIFSLTALFLMGVSPFINIFQFFAWLPIIVPGFLVIAFIYWFVASHVYRHMKVHGDSLFS